MTYYYLDASAWVKRYYQESGSHWINDLFEENNVFVCSPLGFVEVLSALSNKRVTKGISSSDFNSKADELNSDWTDFFDIDLDRDVLFDTRKFLKHHYLKGSDTIHLCSAIILNNQLSSINSNLVFVSSDKDLLKAAEAQGLSVVDPNDFP